MKLKIIFENSQFLVVDKPSGLVVNKSETVKEETLQDQLSRYFGLSGGEFGIGGRSGIVHRLDRETSGLIVVAKVQKAFNSLQEQFRNRLVEKQYIALVHGSLKEADGDIKLRIGRIGKFGKFGVMNMRSKSGRETETSYKLIDRFRFKDKEFLRLTGSNLTKARINYLKNHGFFYSLLTVFPKTGRTHQIRVALKSIGYPVVSDLIYTPGKLLKFDLLWCKRLFLHASKLTFMDPVSKEMVEFRSDLSKDLKNAMLNLEEMVNFKGIDRGVLESLSNLGIAFLLFLVGIELKLEDLKSVGKAALLTGVGQIVFTALIGFIILSALGFSPVVALYVAVAITFSSTVIIIKLLSEKHDLQSLYGKIAVGFLLVQDFVAILALVILSGFGQGRIPTLGGFIWIFVKGILLVLLAYLLTKFALKLIFKMASVSTELLFVAAIAWALFFSAVAEQAGFSIAIGAFLAGVAIASSPFRIQISARVKPLRDFFIIIFFI